MSSKTGHKIKQRNKANDVFITPLELAKKHIDMIDYKDEDMWLDPSKNNGSYYNQYPSDKKDYCEILEDKDLFIEWFLKSYRVALEKKSRKKS